MEFQVRTELSQLHRRSSRVVPSFFIFYFFWGRSTGEFEEMASGLYMWQLQKLRGSFLFYSIYLFILLFNKMIRRCLMGIHCTNFGSIEIDFITDRDFRPKIKKKGTGMSLPYGPTFVFPCARPTESRARFHFVCWRLFQFIATKRCGLGNDTILILRFILRLRKEKVLIPMPWNLPLTCKRQKSVDIFVDI